MRSKNNKLLNILLYSKCDATLSYGLPRVLQYSTQTIKFRLSEVMLGRPREPATAWVNPIPCLADVCTSDLIPHTKLFFILRDMSVYNAFIAIDERCNF